MEKEQKNYFNGFSSVLKICFLSLFLDGAVFSEFSAIHTTFPFLTFVDRFPRNILLPV